MGVQVPPFALTIITVLILLGGLVSCSGRSSRLVDEQLSHLNALVEILAAHPGDTDAVVADIELYLKDNMKRLMDARRLRGEIMRGMDDDERAAFGRESVLRTRDLRERVRTAIQTFPEPERIMHLARQLFL